MTDEINKYMAYRIYGTLTVGVVVLATCVYLIYQRYN